MENVGAKLVRHAGAKTNDLAGDGSTTSVVLAQGLIAEGMKVLSIINDLLNTLFLVGKKVMFSYGSMFNKTKKEL